MTEKIKDLCKQLKQSVYTGERHLKQLGLIKRLGCVIALIGALTTIMNIVQHNGFVTYTTLAIFVCGVIIAVAAGIYKNNRIALGAAWFFCVIIFTY